MLTSYEMREVFCLKIVCTETKTFFDLSTLSFSRNVIFSRFAAIEMARYKRKQTE